MKKIDFMFVCFIILGLGIFGFIFYQSKTELYSEIEGRNLSFKPNISVFTLSSSQLNSLEVYYQDHFLFRPYFLEQDIFYKRLLGISKNNQIYIGKDYLLEPTSESKQSSDFIKMVNTFYQEHNDIHMSLILIPSHVTVNPSLAPSNAPLYDEYHQIKSIYHQITFDTIDVVKPLKEGNKDYEMYYRLDSHLTSYGAYEIYKEYARLNDLTTSIIDFEIEEVNSEFSGDLVKKAHTFSFQSDKMVRFIPKKGFPLEVIYPTKVSDTIYHEEQKESVEDYFLGTKEPIIEIINPEIAGQELLIMKENSVNMVIPFFVNDYTKVHVIDSTYEGSIADYLTAHKEIKDIVFIYKMNGLDFTMDNLTKLFKS